MYRIEDTTSAIKEVQRLLRLNQSGIYDTATRAAVGEIQSFYGLENTQIVDYKTFEVIVKEYQKWQEGLLNTDYLFNPSFPYVLDNMGDNVGLINDALRIVLKEYIYEGLEPRGKYLGINTLNAANFLRNIFKMDSSNKIDEAFVNRLILEKKAIEIKKRYG